MCLIACSPQKAIRLNWLKPAKRGWTSFSSEPLTSSCSTCQCRAWAGLRTLEEILKLDAEAVVIMITAYATFDTAIAAMQRGAFTVITKPFDNEEISQAGRGRNAPPAQRRRATHSKANAQTQHRKQRDQLRAAIRCSRYSRSLSRSRLRARPSWSQARAGRARN